MTEIGYIMIYYFLRPSKRFATTRSLEFQAFCLDLQMSRFYLSHRTKSFCSEQLGFSVELWKNTDTIWRFPSIG